MSRAIAEGEPSALYEALLRRDVARRRAVQLQKAFDYCAAERFCIDEAEGDFRVLTEAFATADLQAAFDAAHEADAILVVMKPYADRERQLACRSLIQMHDSTSVDNRAYLIIFNSNKLPKQHFRL